MKQTATNSFSDGLNLDLHPIVTPNTVLTDNLNGTFITYNGNEFCLQNDRGNKWVTRLTDGYTPIGIKEHNGILYIVSVNGNLTEIGTFPSIIDFTWITDEDFYKDSHELENVYKALKIGDGHSKFTNVNLGYSVNTPVTIEIQDSYDGSVNLILVADKVPTKIINSGFSKESDHSARWIKRNQKAETNIYHIDDAVVLNQELNLIRTSNQITKIDLGDIPVQSGGQLKGGNYTFYIKFGDGDYNQTDVVAESGIVSIFNGNDGIPSTISGTLADERTDKMVNLVVTGLNHVYSKIYIYYSREYSDTQGYRMTEYGMFNEPIDMETSGNTQSIWLTGFEQTVPINSEELNVDYHTIDWARAEAQQSNMLFLGNVGQKETFDLYKSLKDYTRDYVTSSLGQSNMDDISSNNDDFDFSNKNYYSTKNIYRSLGYWPNEWYRFGIVYILDDGSTTPVFNMKGWIFSSLTNKSNSNDYGVFKTPDIDILSTEKPLHFNFSLNLSKIPTEYKNKIKGWFVVRQKRIPMTICQAISIGTDKRCHLPLIPYNNNWYIESFLSLDRNAEDGEAFDKESGSAAIYQISGEPHILRPFLELFDGTQKLTKINLVNGIDADYLVVYNNQEPVFSQELENEGETDENSNILNPYTISIDSILTSCGFNSNNDVYVHQPNIETNWNTQGQKHTLSIRKYSIYAIKEDDNYVTISGKSLYYGYVGEFYPGRDVVWESQPETFYTSRNRNVFPNINGTDEPTITPIYKIPYRFIIQGDSKVNKNALLSLDPCVNNAIGSMLDGSKFDLVKEYSLNSTLPQDKLVFTYNVDTKTNSSISDKRIVFINENTRSKVIDDNNAFSNVAGSATSAKDFEYTQSVFGVKAADETYSYDPRITEEYGTVEYSGYNSTHNLNLVRGLFTPYIGTDATVSNGLYSIRLNNINDNNARTIREQDNSEYYSVTDRFDINNSSTNVFRGDCYICRVGMRILKNFIDSTVPTANVIVDELAWEKYVRQRSNTGPWLNPHPVEEWASYPEYESVNLSDLNTVDLGYWVSFPCLSSYNLGLRSIDTFHTDEMSLLGSPRSFYPLSGASTINKVGDSYLLNDGLSATVGRKRYNLMPDVPYSKSEFANRIMFSNVNVTDAYTNGYRTFQGLAYKDYDKQYGDITKLISLGQNIFIVMEHGLGLVPVNPKALMQTTTGETIHIYGYGVLPDEMTIISQDYGSKYEHSVIRTPIGIYGIDVDAKKIWRFSDRQGFETISDMKIETYLKNNLVPQEIEMGGSDIRTHYNGKKGDLMFTWYRNGDIYSICYNERQNLWVTRYDWTPIVSENINDEFYSLNIGSKPSPIDYPNARYHEGQYSIWDHYYGVGKPNAYVSTWYDNDKGFEFEFVVSDPIGVNKIYEDLQIISNNAEPNTLVVSVIGDDYTFKRDKIDPNYEREEYPTNKTWTTSNIHNYENVTGSNYRELEDTSYKWDWRLHQHTIVKVQTLKDIYKHGRRLGNMQYKNGMWFIQIEPLRFNIEPLKQQMKEARIRDKWAKIRIRYSGKDLAIITAIRTLINV